MEEGHYNLSGAEFDVGFAVIGQHCKAQSRRYFFGTPFRLGTKPASFAHYQTYSDPRFVAFRGLADTNNILAITLYIQLHNFDHKWHPRLGDCVAGHYDDHYDNNHWRQAYTFAPELLAVVGYTPDYAASCLEGIAFEAHYIYGITSDPRFIPFYWLYDKIPGVFGMVNSFVGGDDITVRSFNHSTVGVGVIAQESQCDKGSFIHIQAETQSFFIIGPNKLQSVVLSNPYTTLKAVQGKCEVGYCDQDGTCYGSSAFVESPTGVPTGIPTAIPTPVPSPFPTVDPTGIPTAIPTPVPSPLPTYDPTGMPTPFPTQYPSGIPTVGPTETPVCINFLLMDKFGDGWDSAKLYLFDSYSAYETFAPTCPVNPTYTMYCFDPELAVDGDYVTAVVNGYNPKKPWEVRNLLT